MWLLAAYPKNELLLLRHISSAAYQCGHVVPDRAHVSTRNPVRGFYPYIKSGVATCDIWNISFSSQWSPTDPLLYFGVKVVTAKGICYRFLQRRQDIDPVGWPEKTIMPSWHPVVGLYSFVTVFDWLVPQFKFSILLLYWHSGMCFLSVQLTVLVGTDIVSYYQKGPGRVTCMSLNADSLKTQGH